jgi:hypothetical protein
MALNEQTLKRFNGWQQELMSEYSDDLDNFFQGPEELMADWIYRDTASDTTREYARAHRWRIEGSSSEDTGPDAWTLGEMVYAEDYLEKHPRAHIHGKFQINMDRLPTSNLRPLDMSAAVPTQAELVAAQYQEMTRLANESRQRRLLRILLTENAGAGATVRWRTDLLPFFHADHVIWESQADGGNIQTPVVSSLSAPTANDAYDLADAAQKHFLKIDQFRGTMVDTSRIRDSGMLKVLVTNDEWDKAFQALRDNENLAQRDNNITLSDQSVYSNKWRDRIQVLRVQGISAGDPTWVRFYLFGSDQKARPLHWRADLGVRPYALPAPPSHVVHGIHESYYLDAGDPSTGLLFKPTEPA